ncbi:MAG: hypothetical protein PHN84_02835 [Desulfuromonadaceae bacterium]|nr:hypothetical protein [Desulfuromonadaceae bacterium]MDD2856798.1 hypothetical protein [Desulfuromonadaceae bacterium]
MRFLRFLILFVLLIVLSGCNTSDNDNGEILKLLATRTNALNSKDISRYISVISLNYSDKGKNFSQLKESISRNFSQYETLAYEADSPEITINGKRAESSCSYRLKLKTNGREITLNGVERLELIRETAGWRIIAGI